MVGSLTKVIYNGQKYYLDEEKDEWLNEYFATVSVIEGQELKKIYDDMLSLRKNNRNGTGMKTLGNESEERLEDLKILIKCEYKNPKDLLARGERMKFHRKLERNRKKLWDRYFEGKGIAFFYNEVNRTLEELI